MKRVLTFLFVTLLCTGICSADIINIKLYCQYYNTDVPEKEMDTRSRSAKLMPSAIYDTDAETVSIMSPMVIDNVHITVTNSDGFVIVDEYAAISSVPFMFRLPSSGDGECCKVVIEYGQTCLYGTICI